jgi:hypothetical protein
MLLLIIMGLMYAASSAWCFRVARRLPLHAGEDASNIYLRLLVRMWWRTLIVAVIFGLFLAAGRERPEQMGEGFGTAIGMYPIIFLLLLMPAWRAAKQQSARGSGAPAGEYSDRLTATRQRVVEAKSTWWKRLFTVLEITVAILAAVFDVLVYLSGIGLKFWAMIALIIVAVGIVRLIRIGVTYVVEGRKDSSN